MPWDFSCHLLVQEPPFYFSPGRQYVSVFVFFVISLRIAKAVSDSSAQHAACTQYIIKVLIVSISMGVGKKGVMARWILKCDVFLLIFSRTMFFYYIPVGKIKFDPCWLPLKKSFEYCPHQEKIHYFNFRKIHAHVYKPLFRTPTVLLFTVKLVKSGGTLFGPFETFCA